MRKWLLAGLISLVTQGVAFAYAPPAAACEAFHALDLDKHQIANILRSSITSPLDYRLEGKLNNQDRNAFSWCLAQYVIQVANPSFEPRQAPSSSNINPVRLAVYDYLVNTVGDGDYPLNDVFPAAIFQRHLLDMYLDATAHGDVGLHDDAIEPVSTLPGSSPSNGNPLYGPVLPEDTDLPRGVRTAERSDNQGFFQPETPQRAPRRQPAREPATRTEPSGSASSGTSDNDVLARPATTPLKGPCLPDAVVRAGAGDRDVAKMAETIIASGLCVRSQSVQDGRRGWRFTVLDTGRPGPHLFLPHDNEQESFIVALEVILQRGGLVVAVEANENRNFAGVDPNRHFGLPKTETRSCKSFGPKYTAYTVQLFGETQPVITLHNNRDGGSVSADPRKQTRKDRRRMGAKAQRLSNDPDNFVYVASRVGYSKKGRITRLFDTLVAQGVNSIFEYVTPENNDCSLSNFIALNYSERVYVNVEAQHGALNPHRMITNRVLDIILR